MNHKDVDQAKLMIILGGYTALVYNPLVKNMDENMKKEMKNLIENCQKTF